MDTAKKIDLRRIRYESEQGAISTDHRTNKHILSQYLQGRIL